MFKFTRKPQADDIYTVTQDDVVLGTVARVGYNGQGTWVAYGAGEELRGPRYSFITRGVAAERLEAYASTGNREWIAPAN